MEEKKIFVPHELKTIEVDVKKNIFRVNGEDFGKGCTSFSINCDAMGDSFFRVDMRIDTEITYLNYDEKGNLTKQEKIEKK